MNDSWWQCTKSFRAYYIILLWELDQIILQAINMSKGKNTSQGKPFNPLHTSFILPRNEYFTPNREATHPMKLSHIYTKATSEFDSSQQDNSHLIAKYQNRIKGLESGYQRSKQQYQNSLKSMYKEKMILLNIISHNQGLIDQFRNKVRLNTTIFKEVQAKYNIIASGIFHNQLCSNCILNVTNTDLHHKGLEKEREIVKLNETVSPFKKKKLVFVKQYSWMYVPNTEHPNTTKLRAEVTRLKLNIDELTQEHSRRIAEKNREIDYLKLQLTKIPTPTHTIVLANPKDDKTFESLERLTPKHKQKVKQLQSEVLFACLNKQKHEVLLKQANEKLVLCQLQRLNSKYRNKFF